jgi:hypothetical protein
MAEATGERFYLAELYRLQGEVCAHPAIGQNQKAEESLRLAINIAKQQGAAALERKAHESLRRRSHSGAATASPSFMPSASRRMQCFGVQKPRHGGNGHRRRVGALSSDSGLGPRSSTRAR